MQSILTNHQVWVYIRGFYIHVNIEAIHDPVLIYKSTQSDERMKDTFVWRQFFKHYVYNADPVIITLSKEYQPNQRKLWGRYSR